MQSRTQFLQLPNQDGSQSGTLIDGYASSVDFTTAGNYLGNHAGFCVQVSCPSTGSPDFAVSLQGSCDLARVADQSPDGSVSHWFPVPFADSTGTLVTSITVNGADVVAMHVERANYLWVRTAFDFTSGSGTITAKINKKEI